MECKFVWIDLSTFDVEKASSFYRKLFRWQFSLVSSGYYQASLGGVACAGLYSMPESFRKIQMPSFWMTYISVTDVATVASKAREFGGKIELEEESSLGRIALIRDPSGAGFTCLQQEHDSIERSFTESGRWCWTELLVSDVSLVKDFYSSLFGWNIQQESSDRYGISTVSGLRIGAIQKATEDVKGSEEYWAVYFAVSDLSNTMHKVEKAGGHAGRIFSHEYGTQGLAYDNQGAAFFLIQKDKATDPFSSVSNKTYGNFKWRSLIGLIAIYLIVLFEQEWGWGLLFLFWVIPDLKSGTTYFIEPLSRRSNPFLYWSVVLTWIGFSVYMLLDFLTW